MHRHDAFFGQQVVKQRKDRFFVLAGIFSAPDQDHLAIKVHRDHSFGPAIVLFRVSLEAGAVDYGEICSEIIQRFTFGTAQHGADE